MKESQKSYKKLQMMPEYISPISSSRVYERPTKVSESKSKYQK